MIEEKKGMLRHVDVLGRVVIPREVRKALRINYGDLMEFCACSNQQVMMRKFHLMSEISNLVLSLIKICRMGIDCDIYVFDTEKIVCKNEERLMQSNELNTEIIKYMENRKNLELKNFALSQNNIVKLGYLIPVLSNGDLLGGVLVSSENLSEKEILVAKELAKFLSNYFNE